jgi:hypothetical protein
MSIRAGFSYVDTDGFISFKKELESNSWKEFDISAWLDGGGGSLLQAPFVVVCKVRLHRAIANLATVLQQISSTNLAELDSRWDSLQRRLHYKTADLSESEDAKISSAALRVRSATLKGEGTAQTNLTYQKEVAWGRKQVTLCREKPLSDDVALLELGGLIDEIEKATEAFAVALDTSGTTGESSEATARNDRLLEAKAECRQACNSTLNGLELQLEQRELAPNEKTSIEACLAPLRALLKRYSSDQPEVAAPTIPDSPPPA